MQGTEISNSVLSVKPGTITEICANCRGRTVSAQRAGSPKTSPSASASVALYRRRWGSIRIWARSMIEWTTAPVDSVARIVNERVGPAA